MNKQFFRQMEDAQNQLVMMQNQILPFVQAYVATKVKPETQRCAPRVENVSVAGNVVVVLTFQVDVWGDESEETYTANIDWFIETFCK